MVLRVVFLLFFLCISSCQSPNCNNNDLHQAQYTCEPTVYDFQYQEIAGCSPDGFYVVNCTVRSDVLCTGSRAFQYEKHCRYVYFSIAMLLSLFGGILGLDRFYLGYYTLGVVKVVTLGFFTVGLWIDPILISMELLKGSDGGQLIAGIWGPKQIYFGD